MILWIRDGQDVTDDRPNLASTSSYWLNPGAQEGVKV
jgi:hypothetical protein